MRGPFVTDIAAWPPLCRVRATRPGLPSVVLVCCLALAACTNTEELLSSAATNIEQGNYRAAVLELHTVLRKDTESARARSMLAEALFHVGDIEAAKAESDKAREFGADSDDFRLLGAQIAYYGGEPSSVLDWLDRLDSDAALALRARALQSLGRREDARAIFARLSERPTGAALGAEGLAMLAVAEDRASVAMEIIDDALGRNETAALLSARASALTSLRLREQALATMARAYDLSRREPEVIYEQVTRALALAQLQLQSGEVEAARATVDDIDGRVPGLMPVTLMRAWVLVQLGDGEQARDLLLRVNAAAPENPEVLLLLGMANLQTERLEQAEMLLRRAVEVRPDGVAQATLLGQLLLSQGKIDEVARLLQRTIDSGAEDAQLLSMYSAAKLALGDSESSAFALQQALDLDPGNSAVQLQLIATHYQNREIAAAERAVNRLLDGTATLTFEARVRLVDILLRYGQHAFARDVIGRWDDASDDAYISRLLLAFVEASSGKESLARQLALEVQRERPDFPGGYLLQGDIDAAQGRTDAAIEAFMRANELRPSSALTLRIAQLMSSRSAAEAQSHLARWLERHPVDGPVRAFLAQLLQASGDRAAAIEQYRQLLDQNADNVVALNNLAWLLDESGNAEEALGFARRAFDRSRGDIPQIADTYGWLLARSGRHDEALPILSNAVKKAPEIADIQYHYAWTLAQTGDAEQAAAVLDEILAGRADFSSRRDAEALRSTLSNE